MAMVTTFSSSYIHLNFHERCCHLYFFESSLAVVPLPLEQLPKSTIGKLSRRTLQKRFETDAFAQLRIHLNVSNMKISFDEFILSDALHHLDFDSIDYMRIKKCFEDAFRFDKKILIVFLFRCFTIHELEKVLLSLKMVNWTYDPIMPLSVRHMSTLQGFECSHLSDDSKIRRSCLYTSVLHRSYTQLSWQKQRPLDMGSRRGSLLIFRQNFPDRCKRQVADVMYGRLCGAEYQWELRMIFIFRKGCEFKSWFHQ